MPESTTHTRRNLLTGAEILVTAGRLKRPWQGQRTTADEPERPPHDPSCYLCPGNLRSEGETRNPRYTSTYCFTNDFSALQGHTAALPSTGSALLQWAPERGICEVVIYSPRHDLTMANMTLAQIVSVIKLWQGRYQALLQRDDLAYVQIFQNEQMGSSNPHPHGQIWATENLLGEPELEDTYQRLHYDRWQTNLLLAYLSEELKLNQRLVYHNEHFVVVVPFWAAWPFEVLVLPRTHRPSLTALSEPEVAGLAMCLAVVNRIYAKLFNRPRYGAPYTMGIHQLPAGVREAAWQMHIHFEPPGLGPQRPNADKHMVGFERYVLRGRDTLPETAAETMRQELAGITLPT